MKKKLKQKYEIKNEQKKNKAGYTSITRVHAKSKESSLSEGYNSKSCIQRNQNKKLVLGPIKITAATPPHFP